LKVKEQKKEKENNNNMKYAQYKSKGITREFFNISCRKKAVTNIHAVKTEKKLLQLRKSDKSSVFSP
jgi:hypothetical protein